MNFSVLIPTRNRPRLFEQALASVLGQDGADLEVVVVDDGTVEPHRQELISLRNAAAASHGERVRFLHLPHLERGHGQSYALNFAASHARGRYLCFLDDDDYWTDPGYLAQASRVVARAGRPPDLLFFDQAAFDANGRIDRPVWLEDLGHRLANGPTLPGEAGDYEVAVGQLLGAHGFCHVNTTIIRREFFASLGGFDEAIRYECDRDFYLRAVDRAETIRYVPRTVSRHNVPDPTRRDNMSTLVSEIEKRTAQIAVLDKSLDARHPEVAAYARRHKNYALQKVALAANAAGRFSEARGYAVQGLRNEFTMKWLAFAIYLSTRATFSGRRR